MKIMIDNDLPPRLAKALHVIFSDDGDQVISLRDKFSRSNLTDEEWIKALGREGNWAVMSADQRIAKRRPSRDIFIGAGLIGFFSPPALQKRPLAQQASRILWLWNDIRTQVSLNANGCFQMPMTGSKFRQIGR